MKKYPIGVQKFKEIISGGYVYIDKTHWIYNIINEGKVYFLSRPRRFGKSLLLDTIYELFSGSKELFKGLWIEDKWDWDEIYPVIRIDMTEMRINSPEDIDRKVFRYLKEIAQNFEIDEQGYEERDYSEYFGRLIRQLKAKYNKNVVVLIDEYDSPIISNLDDIETAKKVRDRRSRRGS